jgi:hypothetical protein
LHHRNADVECLPGIVDHDRVPAHEYFALIHLVDPEKAFHEGGFSSSVFTHQGKNFTRFHIDLHVFKCLYTRKSLGDIFHFKQVFSRNHHALPLLHLECGEESDPRHIQLLESLYR